MRSSLLWFAAATLLCRPAALQRADSYRLRYRFAAGHGQRYSIETEVSATTSGALAFGPVYSHDLVEAVVRVDSVAPDGCAVVEASDLRIFPWQYVPEVMDRRAAPRRVTPLGSILAGGATQGKEFVPSLLTELFLPLPAAPVRVGAAWDTSVPDISDAGRGRAREVTCRLVRVEGYGTGHVAILERAYAQPVGLLVWGGVNQDSSK